MAACDPANAEDFARKFAHNQRVVGRGLLTYTHLPCPFCAEPDFKVLGVVSTEAMTEDSTCDHCGRAGRAEVRYYGDGTAVVELVQTGGEDPPAWLQPPPRRIS